MLLADVVRRVLREHKLAAFARMVSFDVTLKPALVVGDADKVRTIVDNLVSNAVKYSPRGRRRSMSRSAPSGVSRCST